jgi:hypothetical protein
VRVVRHFPKPTDDHILNALHFVCQKFTVLASTQRITFRLPEIYRPCLHAFQAEHDNTAFQGQGSGVLRIDVVSWLRLESSYEDPLRVRTITHRWTCALVCRRATIPTSVAVPSRPAAYSSPAFVVCAPWPLMRRGLRCAQPRFPTVRLNATDVSPEQAQKLTPACSFWRSLFLRT